MPTRRMRRAERIKPPLDMEPGPNFMRILEERATAAPIDHHKKNLAALKRQAVPREPLPEWYLASIPDMAAGMDYFPKYSGQRLNPIDAQRERLRATLGEFSRQGKHFVYGTQFQSGDGMGEGDLPPNAAVGQQLTRRGSAASEVGMRRPWSNAKPDLLMRDGTRSHFGLFQPSESRVEELTVPFGLEEQLAVGAAAKEDFASAQKVRGRWDALPSRHTYFDTNPEMFRSVFMQTEEEAMKEKEEKKEGAIKQWEEMIVVESPILKLDLKSRDKVPQSERFRGMLADPAEKKALRGLYRGKRLVGGKKIPLTTTPIPGREIELIPYDSRLVEPSAFMHESTIEGIQKFESSLRPHTKELWKGDGDFYGGPLQTEARALSGYEEIRLARPTAATKRSAAKAAEENSRALAAKNAALSQLHRASVRFGDAEGKFDTRSELSKLTGPYDLPSRREVTGGSVGDEMNLLRQHAELHAASAASENAG